MGGRRRAGLIVSRPFFSMLANRQFPAGTFVRTPEQLDYLEEPDIFHDVFGHVPLLTHPAYLSVDKALHGLCPLRRPRETPRVSRVAVGRIRRPVTFSTVCYAAYMQAYGRAGLDAIDLKGVKFLARLNWYTIEFGLMLVGGHVKAYGAGIMSSYGEARYVLHDPSPHVLRFDLERVLRTGYSIDDFQATSFAIDSFEALFEECITRPFAPLYESSRAQPPLTPFEIHATDTVLRRGTGASWKDFPARKTALK